MHTQRAMAEQAVSARDNDVLALEGNRGNVRRYMDDPHHAENVAVSEEVVESGHERMEISNVAKRTPATASAGCTCARSGLAAFGAVDMVRETRAGISAETCHFIVSEAISPERLLQESGRTGVSIASGVGRDDERGSTTEPDKERDAKHRSGSRKTRRRSSTPRQKPQVQKR